MLRAASRSRPRCSRGGRRTRPVTPRRDSGLDPAVRIGAVGCEAASPSNDVGVALTDGGFILAQAKRGMRRLDTRAADLRSAVDQLVRAMIDGLHVNGVAIHPRWTRRAIAWSSPRATTAASRSTCWGKSASVSKSAAVGACAFGMA